ncbi:MAG: hypothetical protein O2819_07430 [Planctomycetota bacterium]|nr:hypothetical protein [Planctomycetota bacterium]MDA1106105.1 hypothetical protein [Planctomycetota bacterium]
MIKIATSCAVMLVSGSALAGGTHVDTFIDSQNDLFDNGLSNLDITQVSVTQQMTAGGLVLIDMAITTRGMSDWTKYMVFLDFFGNGGAPNNPWGRPISFGSQGIDSFIGGWIDGSGGNEVWGVGAGGWALQGSTPFFVDWANNTVHYQTAIDIAFAGVVIGMDVATSGGRSGDAGVDHLSRSDMAMGGWGQSSESGQFVQFTIIPAPGAIALFGLVGLSGSRRRR